VIDIDYTESAAGAALVWPVDDTSRAAAIGHDGDFAGECHKNR
jgi:hypothetical protein